MVESRKLSRNGNGLHGRGQDGLLGGYFRGDVNMIAQSFVDFSGPGGGSIR